MKNWTDFIDSELRGMTKQLASHCISADLDGDAMFVMVTKSDEMLITDTTHKKLEWCLKKYLKNPSLELEIGVVG